MESVYELVTAQIVAELEKGSAPWVKPWKGSGVADLPFNAASGRRYNGVNVLLLWGTSLEKGYGHSGWLTYLQAKTLGGHLQQTPQVTQSVLKG